MCGGAGNDVEGTCNAVPFHRQCSSVVALSSLQVLTEGPDQHRPHSVLFCARGFGAFVRHLLTLLIFFRTQFSVFSCYLFTVPYLFQYLLSMEYSYEIETTV